LREAQGWTQEDVAERAGYSAKYISEIERGRRDPPLSTLARIAERGLGCSFDDVVGADDDVRRPKSASEALPANVRAVADEIAALPSKAARGAVIAVLRAAMALARVSQRQRRRRARG
jgi:transcriptional regulator with XRE-family HTH domain